MKYFFMNIILTTFIVDKNFSIVTIEMKNVKIKRDSLSINIFFCLFYIVLVYNKKILFEIVKYTILE
jgi:hypothetical protein